MLSLQYSHITNLTTTLYKDSCAIHQLLLMGYFLVITLVVGVYQGMTVIIYSILYNRSCIQDKYIHMQVARFLFNNICRVMSSTVYCTGITELTALLNKYNNLLFEYIQQFVIECIHCLPIK